MVSNWIKIYLFLVVAVAISFIGVNILAQIETEYKVKDYIKGQPTCPNFVNVNDLTVKDECSGLVWSRRELHTFQQLNDPTPGYNWQQAKTACEDLEPVGMYRLPTVEELITLIDYSCTANACIASLDSTIADPSPLAFSAGIYWTINDFNEPASWGTDNIGRDYKRSVNLLTGKADTPVFGQQVRLNAWCIVNRTPEVVEKKFISANSDLITNGEKVTDGILKTVYNRKCSDDAGCSALTGTACHDGYCDKTENIDFISDYVISCDTGYRIEGASCQLDVSAAISCSPGYIVDNNVCVPDGLGVCGDNVINTNRGEMCDDGLVNGFDGFCNNECDGCANIDTSYPTYAYDAVSGACVVLPYCGNNFVETGETCDGDGIDTVASSPADSSAEK